MRFKQLARVQGAIKGLLVIELEEGHMTSDQ
jgi:hypothetical protein